MAPKVSVIMPSLNVASYIQECILSVINQSLSNIEILCIDAGSTDGTLEILREYQKSDSRVNVFVSDVKSYGAQVNLGIKIAKGEYISIIETDDFIETEMLEILSKLADKYQVDYVKADYDSFCVLRNGEKNYERNHIFKNHLELYNKVIEPTYINDLYVYDYNLWKGIYRTSFLQEKNILLNESSGAAYQDIGFTEMVLAKAKKAYYSDASFYRYRLCRTGSSCSSMRGLKYSFEEFSRLLRLHSEKNFILNMNGFFLHMATSYVGELIAYWENTMHCVQDEELVKCCQWFQDVIERQINNQVLIFNDIPKDLYNKLNKAIYYPNTFFNEIAEKKANREQICKRQLSKSNIVIFGAGKAGRRVRVELDGLSSEIIAFADNRLKGKMLLGTPIYGLSDCISKYPDANYIIASYFHMDDMYEEYLQAGGHPENCIRNWL